MDSQSALAGHVSKVVEQINEALEILLDKSERCLVEVGRLLIEGPHPREVVP